jgi:hypothetical protein
VCASHIFDITPNPKGGTRVSASGFGHPTCVSTGDPSTLPRVKKQAAAARVCPAARRWWRASEILPKWMVPSRQSERNFHFGSLVHKRLIDEPQVHEIW